MASISGTTRQNNIMSECTVRLYRADDGSFVSEMQSVGGNYEFNSLLISDEFYVVCIGNTGVCPKVSDILTPS